MNFPGGKERMLIERKYHRGRQGRLYLGLSTVPYTATAVLLTVSIRPRTVPYFSRTHLFEFIRRYGMVTIMAVYGSRRVYGTVKYRKFTFCNCSDMTVIGKRYDVLIMPYQVIVE